MASAKNNKKTSLKESGEKARDLFYAGVGFAAHAKEHVAGLVEELKKQGKLSKPEGEKIVKDFITDSKKARDKFEDDVKSAVNEVAKKASLASQKELDMLKRRLLELEGKGLGMVKNMLSGKKGGAKAKVADVKKKATSAAKTVASTAKKVVAAKSPAKAASAVKAGAKKVVKTATAKPAAKKSAAPKKAAPKKAAAKKAAAPKADKA